MSVEFKMSRRHVEVARRVGYSVADVEAERLQMRGVSPSGPLAYGDLLDMLVAIRAHRELGALPFLDQVACARVAARAAVEHWALLVENAHETETAAPPGDD